MRNNKVLNITYTAVFTALMAVCAQIVIPAAVPFTMQTFALYLSLLVIGAKGTFIAVLVYLLLGLAGIPVFSGFKGGLTIIVGPSGGYVVGFLFSCIVFGLLNNFFKKNQLGKAFALFISTLFCYAFGTLWFVHTFSAKLDNFTVLSALIYCVFPFLIPDFIKILLSLYVSKRLKKISRFEM